MIYRDVFRALSNVGVLELFAKAMNSFMTEAVMITASVMKELTGKTR